MPNMTMPSSQLIQLVLIQVQVCGAKNARAATPRTMSAIHFPTKLLTFSSVFMLLPFCRRLPRRALDMTKQS